MADNYLIGTHASFCREHNLVFFPDERVWPFDATRCPVDGAKLKDWRETVNADFEEDEGDGEGW